jgi:hypothetical protein
VSAYGVRREKAALSRGKAPPGDLAPDPPFGGGLATDALFYQK